ncbi:MAG: bacteriophage abortive infection AbiH family protein [Lactobacillus iners]|nr:bacteriophage abortive infection AbiH family protein [Lactobacillus iners]
MRTLYIIGNGFDLHFNLKTKTDNFENYLKNQTIYNGVDNASDVFNSYGVNWYEYEQSLNDIDLDEIESQNEIKPDYLSDRESDRDGGIVNMQMYVGSLSEAIRSALEQMVISANEDALVLSEDFLAPKLFEVGDAILTFNYTSTIEILFEVPDSVPIFHIHGCYEQGTPLVFGYRNNQNSYVKTWPDMDEDNWDYYVAQQREVVYDFYSSLEKKLEIDKLVSFLLKCGKMDRVVVLGHSMSPVDYEYMEKVDATLNPRIWEISYYNENDIHRVQSQGYSFQQKMIFKNMDMILNRS